MVAKCLVRCGLVASSRAWCSLGQSTSLCINLLCAMVIRWVLVGLEVLVRCRLGHLRVCKEKDVRGRIGV